MIAQQEIRAHRVVLPNATIIPLPPPRSFVNWITCESLLEWDAFPEICRYPYAQPYLHDTDKRSEPNSYLTQIVSSGPHEEKSLRFSNPCKVSGGGTHDKGKSTSLQKLVRHFSAKGLSKLLKKKKKKEKQVYIYIFKVASNLDNTNYLTTVKKPAAKPH